MIERQTTHTVRSDNSDEKLVPLTSHRSERTDRGILEVRVRALAQLFDAMDPSPFREKELDDNAEEYIVESVKELPRKPSYLLIIHLDQTARHSDEEAVVEEAIQVHFARRAELMHRDLRRLLRRGVISLGIGTMFFSALFAIGQLIGRLMGETTMATLLRQGLLVAGWVVMWRPLEIFLYDWWPILGDMRIYDRLSQIKVQIDYRELVTDAETANPKS